MRPLFHSSLQDSLGKLAKNEYASDEERDALLQAVFETQNIKPRDVGLDGLPTRASSP